MELLVPQLIVYGTKNLRVADLSILPLHIAAHTQSKSQKVCTSAWVLTPLFNSHCICHWGKGMLSAKHLRDFS